MMALAVNAVLPPSQIEPGDLVDGRFVVRNETELSYRSGARVRLHLGDPFSWIADRRVDWVPSGPTLVFAGARALEPIPVVVAALPPNETLVRVSSTSSR